MLKTCPVCGRIHDARNMCRSKRTWRKKDDAASRFRNTAAWQRARDAARESDMNLCVVCRSRGAITTDGLSVHHIVPIEEDYSLRLEQGNLVTLCSMHHDEAERGLISASELRRLTSKYRKSEDGN